MQILVRGHQSQGLGGVTINGQGTGECWFLDDGDATRVPVAIRRAVADGRWCVGETHTTVYGDTYRRYTAKP